MLCEDAGAVKFPELDEHDPRPENVQADGCPDQESAIAAAELAVAQMAKTTRTMLESYVCPDDQLWGV